MRYSADYSVHYRKHPRRVPQRTEHWREWELPTVHSSKSGTVQYLRTVCTTTGTVLLSPLIDGLATRTRTTTALPFLISRLSTVA